MRLLFVDELAVGIIRADVETGARRIADSFNFKENHAPEKTDRPDYLRVTINEARPGRTTTPAELEQLGLIAPNETIAPLSPVWRFHRSESEVTWADVEAVKLPFIVNGRRLYPNSKRALIIKAIIALLKKRKSAQRSQILEELRKLQIDITSHPFYPNCHFICRGKGGVVGWSMNNCCDLDEQGNNENRTPPTQRG